MGSRVRSPGGCGSWRVLKPLALQLWLVAGLLMRVPTKGQDAPCVSGFSHPSGSQSGSAGWTTEMVHRDGPRTMQPTRNSRLGHSSRQEEKSDSALSHRESRNRQTKAFTLCCYSEF